MHGITPWSVRARRKRSLIDKASAAAGGGFEARLLAARLFYDKWEICTEIQVCEPGKLGVALLGRHEFFSKFTVRYMWHEDPPVFSFDPQGVKTSGGKRTKKP
jgi:hypothetical protein